jgi:hypothetical protein
LSQRLAFLGSRVAETTFKTPCIGSGFVMLDLPGQTTSAIPLPSQAQTAIGTVDEMNDYVYALSLDTTRTASSDTIFVMDGVNANVFTLNLPSGVSGFTDASLRKIPSVNSLLATTIDKIAGDQGLVLFNLDLQSAKALPVPAGFTAVEELDDGGTPCCLATRKLVARATKTGGSSLVIYDLNTNDILLVDNPQGITSIGPAPVQRAAAGGGGGTTPTPPGGGTPGTPGGGGGGGGTTPTPPGGGTPVPPVTPVAPGGAGLPAAQPAVRVTAVNPRANTVAAVAYGGPQGNRQVGVIVVRIP